MLKSRHIFIQQGALKPNDNGSKKFNSSELSFYDEVTLEWIASVNRTINNLDREQDYLLVCSKNDKELLAYSSLSLLKIKQEFIEDDLDKIAKFVKDCHDMSVLATIGCNSKSAHVHCLGNPKLRGMRRGEADDLLLPGVKQYLKQSLLKRIKDVNDVLDQIQTSAKVIIYGGGNQSAAFLRYMNIDRLNIVRIVDKNKAQVFDANVHGTNREELEDADVIIVTPFLVAKEIKRYLERLELKASLIFLSDICECPLLTTHENIWAPDKNMQNINNLISDVAEETKNAIRKANEQSGYYSSLQLFTKHESCCNKTAEDFEFENHAAIVLQGPIVKQQNFTLNTVKLYREYFPFAKIIISVWSDEQLGNDWEEVKNQNTIIVYSKRPEIRGYQNTNLQLTTSYRGIEKAKQLGCEYVFKTRTDMRYYSPDMIMLVQKLMRDYPLKAKYERQKERLVIFPPRYDYYYFISDFFMFGHVDDMLKYWDIDREFSNDYVGEAAETMIGSRYADYLGCKVEYHMDNLNAYKKMICDHFIVIDDKLLEYVWYKYFYNKQWYSEYHYNILNFVDWLAEQEER